MSWILLTVCSALVLGIYDLFKKFAVKDNAVVPVLFWGVATGLLAWLLLRISTPLLPDTWQGAVNVDPVTPKEHIYLFGKGLLVSGSWIFGYFALKHLPITLAGPIRSTSPLWTILLAVLLLDEMPNPWQWTGVAIILTAFYIFSLLGKAEGFTFHRDKWVIFMIVATLLGSISSLYDKVLLRSMGFSVATMQFWFSVYLFVVMLPFALFWRFAIRDRNRFEWRWTIPAVGLGLLITDAFYFAAIADENSLISVIAPVRRTSVLIGFFGGVWLLKERQNIPWKLCSLLIMIAGVILLNWKGS